MPADDPRHPDYGAFSAEPFPNVQSSNSVAPKVIRGDELYYHVVNCLARGLTKAEICQELIAMGYAAQETGPWVDKVIELQREKRANDPLPRFPAASEYDYDPGQRASDGRRHMWIGAIVCVIGIFLTFATYSSARESGGTYYVFHGAIVCGALQFVIGFWRSLQ